MGINDFRIAFDNSQNTYYPGQNVTGNVIVDVDKPKKVRNINIHIKGAADTCWAVDKQVLNNEGKYEDENQTVTGYEEYFNAKYYLLGSASGGEIEIPQGQNVYPFNCTLPLNLPSSFESDYGRIRYTVKAVLDRPWRFDHEAKSAFTVISLLDLNHVAGASDPVKTEMNKSFCCLCCASAPLAVNVTLPNRGYVSGQEIPVKLNVENGSGVAINRIKLTLRKDITLYANQPTSETKYVSKVISEVSKGPISNNEELEMKLSVPPLPPSNLQNCGLIDLSYKIHLKASVDGWYRPNLNDDIDVIIGSIPLSVYQTNITANAEKTASPPQVGFVVPEPSAPPMEFPMTNVYPHLPPPAYAESMFNARSLRDKNESDFVYGLNNQFAPRYPVYNFGPPQQ